jgi:hypothetical protein
LEVGGRLKQNWNELKEKAPMASFSFWINKRIMEEVLESITKAQMPLVD